jgi:hypothetical protein
VDLMKKILALTTTALVALSLFGGAAEAKKSKMQMVDGGVAMMLPFPADTSSCYAGVHRRAAIVAGDQANGAVGYHFDIDPATAGKPFKLDVTGGQGDVNLDITFYMAFGTTDDVTGDPVNAGSPATVEFATNAPGGEKGTVPTGGFTKAIVCMTQGADATFHYMAGGSARK